MSVGLDTRDRVLAALEDARVTSDVLSDDVVDALAAPFARVKPVAVAHDVEPQMAAERDVLRDDP